MGTLADEARSEVPYRKWDWVIESLGNDGPEFVELVGDPSVSAAALHRILVRRGIVVPYRTVHRWAEERR